ncbi:hypothetical protein MPL3356_340052 [Mesorhizobium plurifarium]|uniref:Uncharacterized protein n=1 Tax=Mesorhizobium plurifarium TaxID=69974 RepID=A0A090FPJ5_MESPL|nr:hypothetical protein MPL3356_340052 [Mesorhizobium plurifarium]
MIKPKGSADTIRASGQRTAAIGRRHDRTREHPIAENKPLIGGRRPDMTMLYRSTDRLCRRGAPMQNLAHSASFDSDDKDAPSRPVVDSDLRSGRVGLLTNNSVEANHACCSRSSRGARRYPHRPRRDLRFSGTQ